MEHDYLRVLQQLVDHAKAGSKIRPSRGVLASTGKPVGVYSTFGATMVGDLSEGRLPLSTTKRLGFKSIAHEMLWMLSGSSNTNDLTKHGVTVWNEWAGKDGDLGPVYGAQMRRWNDTHDQIRSVMTSLRAEPYGRRHLVNLWNVADLRRMALPPCVYSFNFHVEDDESLSCAVHQRSADVFLGLPWNIASYSVLTHLVARCLGRTAGQIVWHLDDVHLYANHVEPALVQLGRDVRSAPRLEITRQCEFPWEYTIDDLVLTGYNPHPSIKAEVAV